MGVDHLKARGRKFREISPANNLNSDFWPLDCGKQTYLTTQCVGFCPLNDLVVPML